MNLKTVVFIYVYSHSMSMMTMNDGSLRVQYFTTQINFMQLNFFSQNPEFISRNSNMFPVYFNIFNNLTSGL